MDDVSEHLNCSPSFALCFSFNDELLELRENWSVRKWRYLDVLQIKMKKIISFILSFPFFYVVSTFLPSTAILKRDADSIVRYLSGGSFGASILLFHSVLGIY
jgi:hypothetical protein